MGQALTSRRGLEADIRLLSGLMQRLLLAATLLYPLALAAYDFGPGRLVFSHPWAAPLHLPGPAPGFAPALYAAHLFAAAPLVWGLWRLSRMFAAFAVGEGYSLEAAREFERFAWSLAATAAAEPLGGVVFGLLLRLGGVARPVLAVSVTSADLVALLLGVVLGVVAKVMRMTALLARENAEYV